MTETVNEILETLIDNTWISETDENETSRTQFFFTSDGKFTHQIFDGGKSPFLTKGIFEIKSHDGTHFLKTISEDNVKSESEITEMTDNKFELTNQFNQTTRYILLVK